MAPKSSMSSRSSVQLKTISRLERDGVYAGRATKPQTYNPIVSCNEMQASKVSYQRSTNEENYCVAGFKSHQAIRKSPEPQIKHGHPGQYNPGDKYNSKGFKHKNPPTGELVTLETHNVGDKVKTGDLRRELAKEGHVVIGGKFKHNVLNNERTGDGVMHVRAKDEQELQDIKKKIEAKGMVVDVSKDYRPLWKS